MYFYNVLFEYNKQVFQTGEFFEQIGIKKDIIEERIINSLREGSHNLIALKVVFPNFRLKLWGCCSFLISVIFSTPLHKNRAHRLISIRSDAVLLILLRLWKWLFQQTGIYMLTPISKPFLICCGRI